MLENALASYLSGHQSPSERTRHCQHAKLLREYLNAEKQPYIGLLEGVISDNLCIRPSIVLTFIKEGISNKFTELDLKNTNKLIVIAVNAKKKIDTSLSERDVSVLFINTLPRLTGALLVCKTQSIKKFSFLSQNIYNIQDKEFK